MSDQNKGLGISSGSFVEESLSLNLFWLRIMKEHSLFIRLGLPCDRRELIERARAFEEAYDRLLEKVRRSKGAPVRVIRDLNDESIRLTEQLIEFKTMLLHMLLQCQLMGFNFPLIIDHIRREAIRFVRKLKLLQQGQCINSVTNLINEDVFWMRIMADHSKFIRQLIDPSERQFIEIADEFSEEFDELRFQAEDFESFLKIDPIFVPSLRRFSYDAIEAVGSLREFKMQARDLIARCEIVTIIPELFADHVFREAGRAIEDLRFLIR